MEQCLNRTFSSLRPQPHSRSSRSLRKAREVAEQAQSIERKRFKEPTGLLLWAGEAASRANPIAFGERVRSRANPLLTGRGACEFAATLPIRKYHAVFQTR